MSLGIDISNWQGDVDFNSIFLEKEFVIARSSYGVGFKDGRFEQNKNTLRSLNKPHGFYHYAYPQYNIPENEAQWFLDVIGTPEKDELLVLDHEESWSNFEDWKNWAAIFLEYTKNRLNGYKPLLYINYSKAIAGDWSRVINGDFGLWLALWDEKNDSAPQTQWGTAAMKQYSAQGRVNGINGNVDLNVFFGDINSFKKYGFQPLVQEDIITHRVLVNNLLKFENSSQNDAKTYYDNLKLSPGEIKILQRFNKTQNQIDIIETYMQALIQTYVIYYGVDVNGNNYIEYKFDKQSDALNAFAIEQKQMLEGKTIDLLKITKKNSNQLLIEKLKTYHKPISSEIIPPKETKFDLLTFIIDLINKVFGRKG